MSKKEKLEKDYKNFNIKIEREAENEFKKIQEEGNALKQEVVKVAETLERSLNEKEPKATKKKS
jgi:hypothetical protein